MAGAARDRTAGAGRPVRIGHRLGVTVGLVALLAGQGAVPGEACAQVISESHSTMKIAAANAILSGTVAGVLQRVRGGSFMDGFTRGAAGGLIVYGGKQLAVGDMPGVGLLGRQVAAVGASVIHNAGAGIGAFDELVLPFGLVHLHHSADAERRVRLRLDLVTTVYFVRGLMDSEWRFEPGASLSSGAPVFRARAYRPTEDDWLGHATAGIIIVRERDPIMIRSRKHERAVFAHERVHVLQDDQVAIGLGRTLQGAALSIVPGGEWVDRRVDLGLHYLIMLPAAYAFGDAHMELLEREAHGISGTDRLFLTSAGTGVPGIALP